MARNEKRAEAEELKDENIHQALKNCREQRTSGGFFASASTLGSKLSFGISTHRATPDQSKRGSPKKCSND